MPEIRPFAITTPTGRTLRGLVNLPEQPGPRPTVVLSHGFKGFQEWGFFPALSTLLAQRGFTAIRFNFHGGGMRPGDELVTDTEAFRTATLSGDRDDLLAVIQSAGETIAAGAVDRDRMGLFGHSRGGGAAILAAAHETVRDRLAALVSWSSVCTFDRLDEEQNAAWRRAGSVPVVNARTGQELVVGAMVLEDLQKRAAELDLLAAATRRTAPWLIVHGESDETVPASEAERLAAAAAETTELTLIAGANHTFGAVHPFAGPTPHLIQALNLTQTWFRRYL